MASSVRSGSEGGKPSHVDEKKATTAAATEEGARAARVGMARPAAAREGMTRLPRLEVLRILTRDPRSIAPHCVESILRLVQQARPGLPEEVQRAVAGEVAASCSQDTRENFALFQDWVRGEVEKKGYVEVPDELVRASEEASERHGERVDLMLSPRYFTTVLGDDGREKRVFSLTTEEKAISGSKSKEDNVLVCSTAELHPEVERRIRGNV
jgi:hypothetical protein